VRHWYVYHSQKTVKNTYSSLAESTVFSKSNRRDLCIGDIIWVVEGDLSNPVNFTLVDCFIYKTCDYPPFSLEFSDFKFKFSGTSLFSFNSIALDKSIPWVLDLHSRYLSKQKFFNNIAVERDVINGLLDVSGVVI
jgi:hypothetical protein